LSTRIPSLSRYRVAAIQYEPTLGEKEKNVRSLLQLTEEAARHDARLIVLPEMATTGYCWTSRTEIAPYTEPLPGPTSERFQALATRYDCFIAIGLPEVDPETDVYYNSMVLLGPEGMIGTYRKIHSYISEPRWARDGDLGIPVWDTPLGRLGGLICMDTMYFEAARIPALHDVDVLLFPTNWLDEKCPSSWWMTRAFENGIYIIAANRYGNERGVQFTGGSCILNPDGSIQAYRDNGEGIVYGEIDLERSRDKRWGSNLLTGGDRLADRVPSAYTTLVQNTYLWEPLRYHGLYDLGELPEGQLSCAGIVQMDMQELPMQSSEGILQALSDMLRIAIRSNEPARPDILVLPELLLPGPLPTIHAGILTAETIVQHFRGGAITVPGPEVDVLVALADELQISVVVGIAERLEDVYYSTVLLIDPEGVYGIYRKLHLTPLDKLWATPGNLGLQTFDTPTGRIGLATGYDVLFPETLRVLAGKGADLVCAPAFLDFPPPIGLAPSYIKNANQVDGDEFDAMHHILWRIRAAENNVYLAVANWKGSQGGLSANGLSGIYSPNSGNHPLSEVVAEEDELGLMMMTIDTREQRTGRRTTRMLEYSPGNMAGSLTGELAYDIYDSIPGNAVRGKPFLRKRQPFWYLELVRRKV
jgi:predicted amidohydrolase